MCIIWCPSVRENLLKLFIFPSTMCRTGSLSSDKNLSGNDQKRQRLASSSKTFKIVLHFVGTISTGEIIDSVRKWSTDNLEILQVLDAALQQHAARR